MPLLRTLAQERGDGSLAPPKTQGLQRAQGECRQSSEVFRLMWLPSIVLWLDTLGVLWLRIPLPRGGSYKETRWHGQRVKDWQNQTQAVRSRLP